MSTQLTERPVASFPVADPAWGAAPPPAGPSGTGSAGGGRPRWRRRVAAGVAALALVLSSGLAGAYATTRLEDQPAAIATTAVTAAATTRAATGSLAAVAAKVTPSVVAVTVRSAGQEAEGSGVVLTADGAILTNNHVVAAIGSGATITVEFSDGSTAPASVAGTDPVTDLAVIEAKGVSGLQPATFGDSDTLAVGDTVLAVGSPLGLEGSVTAGIVSALHRTITVGDSDRSAETLDDAVQTDASINPGNSGGPLVDDTGRVVGVTTANASVDGASAGSIGVGFAIPGNQARQVADRLLAAT